MAKITFREVDPEYFDNSWYFDDDGFTSAVDPCYAVYIIPQRNSYGFNGEEYGQIVNTIEEAIEFYQDLKEGDMRQGWETVAELLDGLGLVDGLDDTEQIEKLTAFLGMCEADSPYRGHRGSMWYANESECVAAYQTIMTGKEWTVRTFHGYSQGEWAEIVYCKEEYSDDSIEEFGKIWLGRASEFIAEGEEGYSEGAVLVPDHIVWDGGQQLIDYLANMGGYDPTDVEVYLHKGYTKTPKYKKVEV